MCVFPSAEAFQERGIITMNKKILFFLICVGTSVQAAQPVQDLWTTVPNTGGTVFHPSTFRHHEDLLPNSAYSSWCKNDPYQIKPVAQNGGYKSLVKKKSPNPAKNSFPPHTASWQNVGK